MTTLSSAAAAPAAPLLDRLLSEARAHRAIRHPWLAALAQGELAAPQRALRDFAGSYARYSRRFPAYLRAVIERLPAPAHRELLAENLREEGGELDAEMRGELEAAGIDVAAVDGVPHPTLFQRFHDAVGGARASAAALAAGQRWADDLLAYLRRATPAAAVGALGIGTESIVREVYEQVLAGLEQLDTPRRAERVFFELHCLVDDQHQQDLLDIAAELAADDAGSAALQLGVREALTLRARYFDELAAATSPAEEGRPA